MTQIPIESIHLLRDVDAYMVPSGDEVKLLAGNIVRITQALGGNYTVLINGNMVQITAENADALGLEISEEQDSESPEGNIEQQIWDQLKTCYDPEIPVNIVDLGLVYEVAVADADVEVQMTLTFAGCGMGPYIAQQAEWRLAEVEGIEDINVDLVFDPPWTPDMITEEGKRLHGLD